jgi:2-keto-4-pentenoate hydratase/2-oxohepta-3-ene-1,7-dioic acid hydratase in catechol pathway
MRIEYIVRNNVRKIVSLHENGQAFQNSNTSKMTLPINLFLSLSSEAFASYPRVLITSGTTWACREFATPRRTLRNGDVLKMEVEGIGILKN